MNTKQPTSAKPTSTTHGYVIASNIIVFCLLVYSCRVYQPTNLALASLLIIIITAANNFLFDWFFLKVHKRASTGLNWQTTNYSINRTLTKYFGLIITLLGVALLYFAFPEYHGSFYSYYYKMLSYGLPALLIIALPYIYWVDGRMQDPEDSYFIIGKAFLSFNFKELCSAKILQHALGWLVKAFFLPLMFTYFTRDLSKFMSYNFEELGNFKSYFDLIYMCIFLLDVGIVSIGYMMSLKLFDTHIRQTEPTFKGWIVAIVCYQPFWSLVGNQYINYQNEFGWGTWLADSPTLYVVWGSLILVLFSIYLWASMMFGCRFSNLTNRGVITNGPYAFTKHPAYVSKNLAWWLIAVPMFNSPDISVSIRSCLLLALLNYVYYLRAKTEEANMGIDPIYIEYSKWIDQNGLFKRFKF